MLLKKRQGFTLIELLAVIIISAFIMLIIIPETIRVIERSRKKTFENSMKNLTKAISLKQKELMLDKAPKMLKFEYNDGVESSNISLLSLDYDGKTPENGIIVINRNGKTSLALHNGTYCATKHFFDDDIIIEKKSKEECTIILGDKTFLTVIEDEFGEDYSPESIDIISVDDGYVAVGELCANDDDDDYDAFIIKLNLNGDVEWRSRFGGNDLDRFFSVTSTLDGGYVAVGDSFSTNISGIENQGNNDAIIVKYDATGDVEWAKNFGGENIEWFSFVTSTTDGGYIAVGTELQNGFLGIIVKYDANGDVKWAKNVGGSEFYSVTSTIDGGCVAVGTTEINSDNKGKGLIVKYDKDGNVDWEDNYGNNDLFGFVTSTLDGGYMVMDASYDEDGYNCSYLSIKYNASGRIIRKINFSNNINNNNNGDYYLYYIIPASDGGYIAVGTEYQNGKDLGIIVKYDANGKFKSKETFGDENTETELSCITQANNGFLEGYIIGGFSNYEELVNNSDYCDFILKVDLEGNLDLNP